MLTSSQTAFLTKSYLSAKESGHIFPGAAAAETALESAWGTSKLAVQANNLFGLKKPEAWTGKTVNIPTREYLDGNWTTVLATWPVFGDWAECFRERMVTLHRVGVYAEALHARTPEDFIIEVSQHWATDPERAESVLSIYNHHKNILRG